MKTKKQYTIDDVLYYWEKAPWMAGCWVLYIKPKDWVYPALVMYINTHSMHSFRKKSNKKHKATLGMLMHTYVHPEARRQGLARIGLKLITDWLDIVVTGASTVYAHKVLIRFGFVLDSRTQQYVFKK